MNPEPEQDSAGSTPESGHEKQDGSVGRSILAIVAFTVIRKVLEEWLFEPVAIAVTVLIVLPWMYWLEERKVTLARWLLFTVLLALLFPTVMYGTAYFLCGNAWGAIVYALVIGAFVLSLSYIFAGMEGELPGSLKGWGLIALLVGIVMGVAFHYVPGAFCEYAPRVGHSFPLLK